MLRVFDPARASDYETILFFYNSEYTRSFVGDVGIHTNEDLDARCQTGTPSPAGRPELAPNYPWHISYLRSDLSRGPIGIISLFNAVPFNTPNLGWAVREELAGQGYASEAGKAVLKWWAQDIGVKDIWAGTFPHHKASQRVAVKIGLEYGGEMSLKYPSGEVKEAIFYVLPGADTTSMQGLTYDLSKEPSVSSVPPVELAI